MIVLQTAAAVLVAALALATVRVRDPMPQAIVFGLFGISLGLLFVVLQAPDVALSQLVVGAVAYPAMILLTLAKAREHKRRGGER